MGIAVGGWPGGIEPATAVCRLDANGKLTVVLGSVDLTGTNTSFAQIAAESLGLAARGIVVSRPPPPTPRRLPAGPPGSEITYTVGRAVQLAAEDAGDRSWPSRPRPRSLGGRPRDRRWARRVRGVPGSGISLKDVAGRTMGFAARNDPSMAPARRRSESAPGFAAHLVEVEVDEVTGQTNRAIRGRPGRWLRHQPGRGGGPDPRRRRAGARLGAVRRHGVRRRRPAADGDADGLRAAAGRDGAGDRDRAGRSASEHGAYGAKGIGEPPAIPGAAAVANAIRDLTGLRMVSLPIKPEDRCAAALGIHRLGGRLMT